MQKGFTYDWLNIPGKSKGEVKEPEVLDDEISNDSESKGLVKLQTDLSPFVKKIGELQLKIKEKEIATTVDYQKAIETVQWSRKLKKSLADKGKEHYKDLYDEYKKRLGIVNEYLSMIDNAIFSLQKKIDAYSSFLELERQKKEKEEQKKRDELQKKLDEEAKKADVEPIKIPDAVHSKEIPKVKTSIGSSSIKKQWVFEIIDQSKLPKKYTMPDMKALKEAVEKGGVRKIAGVKIYQKTSTRITTR